MDLKNCIFEELLKAAQPKCGLFVIPLPTGSGNMGHRTKRILRIERKEYQTY